MEIKMTEVVDVFLLSVEQRDNAIEVQRRMEFVDGSTMLGKHVFPTDTLEWRSAEYLIDPADLDTLLDIVIHEPFLGEPDQPNLLLYDAATVQEARDYHLARINAVKARSKRPNPTVPDPVREGIKQLSVINPEAINLKSEFVTDARAKNLAAKEAQEKARLTGLFVDATSIEEERLKRLRARLAGERPTTI